MNKKRVSMRAIQEAVNEHNIEQVSYCESVLAFGALACLRAWTLTWILHISESVLAWAGFTVGQCVNVKLLISKTLPKVLLACMRSIQEAVDEHCISGICASMGRISVFKNMNISVNLHIGRSVLVWAGLPEWIDVLMCGNVKEKCISIRSVLARSIFIHCRGMRWRLAWVYT